MKRSGRLIALILIFSQLGCATLFKSMSDVGTIDLISDPAGASVYLNKDLLCKAPCSFEPDTKEYYYNLSFQLKGHEPVERKLERDIYWPFWLNLIVGLWAVVPMGVDWANGSMWKYTPKTLVATFESSDDESGQGESEESENLKDSPQTPIPAGVAVIDTTSQMAPANEDSSTTKTEATEAKVGDDTGSISSEVRKSVMNSYSDADLDDAIRAQYGAPTKNEVEAAKRRLRRIMAEQVKAGQEPDLDAAIMMDYSLTIRK